MGTGSGTAGGGSRRPRALIAGTGALAVVGVVVALVVTAGDATGPGDGELPGTLVGLPAQASAPSDEAADRLTARLRAEPAVADVAVRAYRDGGTAMVVLDLTPRTALTDETAGELTARVLGAASPAAGSTGAPDDVVSGVSADGLALLTCRVPDPGSSTCVSVEADRALVVLTTGTTDDPVARTADVREEVRAADSP